MSQLRASTQAPKGTNGRRYRALKRARRLRELGYADYDVYLASPHWLTVREQYRQSDRPQDCMCGETERLHLHHLTYDRLGAEEVTDLLALCPNCHTMIHDLEARGIISLDLQGLESPTRATKYADEAAARQRRFPEPHEPKQPLPLDKRVRRLMLARDQGLLSGCHLASLIRRVEGIERKLEVELRARAHDVLPRKAA